jgi:hypothetical protein
MNENSLSAKEGGFARTQEFCRVLVSELGASPR